MSIPSAEEWSRWRFPTRKFCIGETGWPSAGRMREGALPSPVQSGARHPRGPCARQTRQVPRQCHRGVRSAVEAPAGRHGRRTLGTVRRRQSRVQIRLGRAGLRPSALAVAGCRRRVDRGTRICRGDAAPPRRDQCRCRPRAGSASRSSRRLPASSFGWPPKKCRSKVSALRLGARRRDVCARAHVPACGRIRPHSRAGGSDPLRKC